MPDWADPNRLPSLAVASDRHDTTHPWLAENSALTSTKFDRADRCCCCCCMFVVVVVVVVAGILRTTSEESGGSCPGGCGAAHRDAEAAALLESLISASSPAVSPCNAITPWRPRYLVLRVKYRMILPYGSWPSLVLRRGARWGLAVEPEEPFVLGASSLHDGRAKSSSRRQRQTDGVGAGSQHNQHNTTQHVSPSPRDTVPSRIVVRKAAEARCREGFPLYVRFLSYFEWHIEESWKIQCSVLCSFR
jgi:hypothetical protein